METTPNGQRTAIFAVTGLLALAVVAVLALAVMSPGAAEEEPDPIAPEPLTDRAEFTDDVAAQLRNKFDDRGTDVINMRDASNIFVVRFTIQPGATFPWHTHPGPVLITIAEGEFTYVLAEDCVRREYGGGEALVDAGGDNVHTAYNPSDTDETVVVATLLDTPDAPDPVTVPVDEDQMDALDAECDLDTPRPE